MRKPFGLALLALPLLAAAAQAGPFGPYKIEAGCNAYFRVVTTPTQPCGALCGPWYNYWPLEAHFQLPALPHYPYYPPPQVAGKPGPDAPPAPPPVPGAVPAAPAVKPVSYDPGFQAVVHQAPVPSYWYGR
jgi:hypothetical protein